VSRAYALCPYCQLRNGQIFSADEEGQICLCPECGRIPITANDRGAVRLDEHWLR
jgi:hypothetical protein